MHYHFKIHKEDNGYWAECLELEGCNTQADDLNNLKSNMEEVLNLYLSEPSESTVLFPLPDITIEESEVDAERVKVNPKVAFSFIIRHHRILNNFTQQQVAEKLGYKNIYSYQRLEKSSTNPTLDKIAQIKNIYPDLDLALIF